MTSASNLKPLWRSRWTFVLAATGSAVGLGNIWKFPYITGENGGGAFVLFYLLCVACIGIPIMMAEVLLGRHGRRSPIGTMQQLIRDHQGGRFWVIIGWMGALAGFLILSFYSVIAGWALAYIPKLGFGEFYQTTSAATQQIFDKLLANPWVVTGWHTLFIAVTAIVVAQGVKKGLERAVEIIMPLLFLLLLLLVGYAISEGAFSKGFEFLFAFNFEKLTWESCLIAMGHAFFTLSLGMGAIMVYGAYMPKTASISGTVVTIAILDTLVALLAGLSIFPIVFANQLEPAAGPGLMFVSLPFAFGNMHFGAVFGVLFFILVFFAAWTSSISLIEPTVAWVTEKFSISRQKITWIIAFFTWILGLGSVLSSNKWKEFYIVDRMTVFDFLDFLTTRIMLPLGGMLIALYVGWVLDKKIVVEELAPRRIVVYHMWKWFIRIVAPLAVFIVFSQGIIEQFS